MIKLKFITLQKAAAHFDLFFSYALIIIAFLIYTFRLQTFPPTLHGDEEETALQALHLKRLIGVGWFDLPLVSFLPHKIGMLLLGSSIAGNRLDSVIFGVAALPVFYVLVKSMLSRPIAISGGVAASGLHESTLYKMIQEMNKDPHLNYIFLTKPTFDSNYSTFRFLAPCITKKDIENPSLFVPITAEKPTAYFILPGYSFVMLILNHNPSMKIYKTENSAKNIQ